MQALSMHPLPEFVPNPCYKCAFSTSCAQRLTGVTHNHCTKQHFGENTIITQELSMQDSQRDLQLPSPRQLVSTESCIHLKLPAAADQPEPAGHHLPAALQHPRR